MLERELNKYKSKIENNEIKLSKDIQNNNVINSILEKDKEIKELRLKLSRYPIQLEEGEKLNIMIMKNLKHFLQLMEEELIDIKLCMIIKLKIMIL